MSLAVRCSGKVNVSVCYLSCLSCSAVSLREHAYRKAVVVVQVYRLTPLIDSNGCSTSTLHWYSHKYHCGGRTEPFYCHQKKAKRRD